MSLSTLIFTLKGGGGGTCFTQADEVIFVLPTRPGLAGNFLIISYCVGVMGREIDGGVRRRLNFNGERGCILNTERGVARELGLVAGMPEYTLTPSHFNLLRGCRGF